MDNQTQEDMVNCFAEKTGLEKDQFGFFQTDDSGYATLIVIKDNHLVELGRFVHDGFIRNSDLFERYGKAVNMFLDLCVRKFQGEDIKVPDLYGNPDCWGDCYKDLYPELKNKDGAPDLAASMH